MPVLDTISSRCCFMQACGLCLMQINCMCYCNFDLVVCFQSSHVVMYLSARGGNVACVGCFTIMQSCCLFLPFCLMTKQEWMTIPHENYARMDFSFLFIQSVLNVFILRVISKPCHGLCYFFGFTNQEPTYCVR
jgi:hypothetical protein